MLARSSGSPAPGPCARRTSCWLTASAFPSRTYHGSGTAEAPLRLSSEFATRPLKPDSLSDCKTVRFSGISTPDPYRDSSPGMPEWYSVSPRRMEAIQFRSYLDLPVLLARKLVKFLLPGCLAAVTTVLQTSAAVFTDQPSAG